MVVHCEQVWQEISNYVEDNVDAEMRAAMDAHFHECQRCASVLAGTRNLVELYGDERLFRTPLGFSWRLRWKLAQNMPRSRGTAFGWLVATAAVGLIVGTLTVANSSARNQAELRSVHAQPGKSIPQEMLVLVADGGKIFHRPGCTFIHATEGRIESMKAAEAMRAGYAPCVRCLGQYLESVAGVIIGKHALMVA